LHLFVDLADLLDPALTAVVFEVEDVVGRPVKVIGDIGYLLVQPFGGVAYDSPERASST
jgi:hypothetical protein